MLKNLSPFYAILLAGALFSGCASPAVPARTIAVEMKKYTIAPAQIRVKQGESVTLQVAAADVEHGFDVPDLKISEPVKPGKSATIRLDTRKKGTFNVECGIICGARHDEMKAQIIVE